MLIAAKILGTIAVFVLGSALGISSVDWDGRSRAMFLISFIVAMICMWWR
jgi:hypothetical protein